MCIEDKNDLERIKFWRGGNSKKGKMKEFKKKE